MSVGDMEDTLWNNSLLPCTALLPPRRVPPTQLWVVAKHNQITCLQEGMEVTHFKFMERKTSYIIMRYIFMVCTLHDLSLSDCVISLGHS